MPTAITGEVKIHKADGVTRQADAVVENLSGSLSVWDDLPQNFIKMEYPEGSSDPVLLDKRDSNIIEPDILVKPDKWERVERQGHHWKRSSTSSIISRAKRRDGVDEEQIKDTME